MDAVTKKIKYLDPKNDLTFRKIFADHPHLLMSFLNSILPLEEGQKIESIEYLQPEIIPELSGFKRSIVDVHCTDNRQRYFIVEMQMYWTSAFMKRMLFNTGKAYVRQLKHGGKYRDLKPVYGLSLVDATIHKSKELEKIYYHHYKMVHTINSSEKIDGLELIFVELPKFKASNFTDKKIQTLWLRFLTEIDEDTSEVPDDLMNDELIKEAVECVQREAFTEDELRYYDQYWDVVRTDKAAIEEWEEKYKKLSEENQQISKVVEDAKQETIKAKQEAKEAKLKLAKQLKKYGLSMNEIINETGLTSEEINQNL